MQSHLSASTNACTRLTTDCVIIMHSNECSKKPKAQRNESEKNNGMEMAFVRRWKPSTNAHCAAIRLLHSSSYLKLNCFKWLFGSESLMHFVVCACAGWIHLHWRRRAKHTKCIISFAHRKIRIKLICGKAHLLTTKQSKSASQLAFYLFDEDLIGLSFSLNYLLDC